MFVLQAGDPDLDDWDEDIDVSDAAIQHRMNSLTSAAKSLALTDDVEMTQQERLDLLYEYVKASHLIKLLQTN